MKTEYVFTEQEQAELEDINRQMLILARRKADIYIHAQTRYIMETPEEIEAARNIERFRSYGMGPVIKKDGIVKIITDTE